MEHDDSIHQLFHMNESESDKWLQSKVDKSSFECPLCPDDRKYTRNQYGFLSHWSRMHASQKVSFEGDSFLPCFKDCSESEQKRAHYHCGCTKVIFRKTDFLRYVKYCCNRKPISHGDVFKKSKKLATNVQGLKEPKINCELCNKSISKKNFVRHVRNCNKNEGYQFLPCVLVDGNIGLFMVSTGKGGAYHPNHVQVSTTTEPQIMKCFNEACCATMNACGRGGVSTFACDHMISCLRSPTQPAPQRQITEMDVANVRLEKIVKEDTVKKVSDMINKSDNAGCPLAVWWTPHGGDSSNYLYLSVWTENKSYYSKFFRVVVRFNVKTGQFDCPCVTGGLKGCIHQSIAKIHICTNRPDLISVVKKRKGYSSKDSEIDDDQHSVDVNDDQDTLKRETDHVQKEHKIPFDIQEYLTDNPCDIESVCPSDTHCLFCDGSPKLVKVQEPRLATIYDITRSKKGITVFVKQCSICQHKYRYAEYKDGIHMADNTTILSLRLCLMLRSCIRHHTAIGRECAILEESFILKYPAHIFEAYMHFEAQTDHKYDFTCLRCGIYPPILVLDANRKTCFTLTGESINPPKDDISEEVDMKKFWEKIENYVLAAPKCRAGKDNPYKVDVQYSNWAQWIAPESLLSGNVINTEFRKLTKTKERVDELDDIDLQYNSQKTFQPPKSREYFIIIYKMESSLLSMVLHSR